MNDNRPYGLTLNRACDRWVVVVHDFRHSHPVSVHVQKVARIFSNILDNAVLAMKLEGEMWFRTRDVGSFVEFCIGNSGSVIPPEHLPKLFEAFFTSGKRGGTGLGLAIAQKVVTAYGGTIRCESRVTPEHPAGQVEFLFTLPVAIIAEAPRFDGVLPLHTSQFGVKIGPQVVARHLKVRQDQRAVDLRSSRGAQGRSRPTSTS